MLCSLARGSAWKGTQSRSKRCRLWASGAGPGLCAAAVGRAGQCQPSEQLIGEVGTVCLLPLFLLSGAIPVLTRIIKPGSLTSMHIYLTLTFHSVCSLGTHGLWVPSVILG